MRKILISGGFGAGWTTWNYLPEVAKFMLEYQPIIEFIEAGGRFNDGDSSIHPLLRQMCDEIHERFGHEYTCVLGADGLEVVTIPDGEQVQVHEYDGNETYVLRSNDAGWM